MITEWDFKDLLNRMGAPQDPPMPIDHAATLLAEFSTAGEFSAWPASGEELWFGRCYNVHASASSDESFVFVRLKPGRMDVDGVDNVLEYSGFASQLATQGGSEEGDAKKVLNALMRGAAPPADSAAVKYMRTTAPEGGWHGIIGIDGKSKVITQTSPRWLRQNAARMLMIEKLPIQSADRKTPFHAAGRYAELWRVP